MTKLTSDLKAQVEGMMTLMEDLTEKLCSVRVKEAEARITFDRETTALKDLQDRKTFEMFQDPKVLGITDPSSGKSNKDYTKMVIEQELSQDTEIIQRLGIFYDAQQAVIMAQADLINIADRLGTARVQARILGALMYHMTAEAEG